MGLPLRNCLLRRPSWQRYQLQPHHRSGGNANDWPPTGTSKGLVYRPHADRSGWQDLRGYRPRRSSSPSTRKRRRVSTTSRNTLSDQPYDVAAQRRPPISGRFLRGGLEIFVRANSGSFGWLASSSRSSDRGRSSSNVHPVQSGLRGFRNSKVSSLPRRSTWMPHPNKPSSLRASVSSSRMSGLSESSATRVPQSAVDFSKETDC